MKTANRWPINTLVALVTIAASIALAEVLLRAFAPQPPGFALPDRYGLVMHYPAITRYLPQYGHEVSFNQAGMRDRERATAKDQNVFRILLLGDSFMEALQVPFDSAFPSRLEQALPALRGKRTEVVNAAVGGWGTDDQLRYLTEYGLGYKPDLVVIAMTLHNDISDNLRQRWHKLDADRLVEKQLIAMSSGDYLKVRLHSLAASRSQLYQLWRRGKQKENTQRLGSALDAHVADLFREPTPRHVIHGFQLTEQLLASLRDRAATVGAQVVVMLLPIKLQLAKSDFTYFVQQTASLPQEMEIGKPQRVMAEIGTRLGLPVIDLMPAFRQWTDAHLSPLYADHWTAAGHGLAADVVSKEIARLFSN
jgi:hypothetical protein